MAIFHSYVSLPEGNPHFWWVFGPRLGFVRSALAPALGLGPSAQCPGASDNVPGRSRSTCSAPGDFFLGFLGVFFLFGRGVYMAFHGFNGLVFFFDVLVDFDRFFSVLFLDFVDICVFFG